MSNVVLDADAAVSGETDGTDSANDANKLRKDVRKLKEYLKTSVQVNLNAGAHHTKGMLALLN